MMTIALLGVAFLLCCSLTLSSFLVRMYSEVLSLRKRRNRGGVEYFATEFQPLLGHSAEEGKARYTLVQFGSLALLSMDLLYVSMEQSSRGIAILEALALTAIAVVVCAQILPAVLAERTEGRWVARLAWPSRVLGWLPVPLIVLGDFASSVAAVGEDSSASDQAQKPSEEIDALLDAGQKEGLIDGEDRKLIHSVVGFGDKTVREVMTPRPKIVAIAADCDLEQVRLLIREKEHSRIPVYADSIDNVIGFIHSRDTLDYAKEERVLREARATVRPIDLVPETKRIQELMREMQEAHSQIAMVIDEYGQTAGLVTMEDMMEEIVGEIEDETDPVRDVERQSDNSFIAQGGLDLDRLEELVGYRPDEELESTTIGGLVCEHLGQVPAAGAKVRLNGLEVEVLASDGRHVSRVHLRRRSIQPVELGTAT